MVVREKAIGASLKGLGQLTDDFDYTQFQFVAQIAAHSAGAMAKTRKLLEQLPNTGARPICSGVHLLHVS